MGEWKVICHLHSIATLSVRKKPQFPLDSGWFGPRPGLVATEERKKEFCKILGFHGGDYEE
jgi:hypothetical protein